MRKIRFMNWKLAKKRNPLIALTLFFTLFSILFSIISVPAFANTTWEPQPPQPLTERQKVYYSNVENWEKPLEAPVLLLVTISNQLPTKDSSATASKNTAAITPAQHRIYTDISEDNRQRLGLLGELPKYPHLQTYATAGRIAILNPESNNNNAPFEHFFKIFNHVDCYSNKAKCDPSIWSLFDAFGIARQHYSTTSPNTKIDDLSIANISPTNASAFTLINQRLDHALSTNTSLIVTLNLEGNPENLSALDGLLAQLDERVVLYLVNLPPTTATKTVGQVKKSTSAEGTTPTNSASSDSSTKPINQKYGQVISYNHRQSTGVLASSIWDTPGLVFTSGLQTEILARLKLPATETPTDAPWGSFNPSHSGIINLENANLPASQENLNQELQILSEIVNNATESTLQRSWLLLICGVTLTILIVAVMLLRPHLRGRLTNKRSLSNGTAIPLAQTHRFATGTSKLRLLGSATALIAILALLGSGLWAIADGAGFPGKPSKANTRSITPAKSTLVIYTSGIKWSDIPSSSSAELQRITAKAAVFNYLPPSPFSLACPEDYWFALSSGNRASRYSLSGRNICAHPIPSANTPLPLWPYYKKLNQNLKTNTPLGNLGEILADNSIRAAAFGPYAALATVNEEGIPQADLQTSPTDFDHYGQKLSEASKNYPLIFADVRGVNLNTNPERINQELKTQQSTLNKIVNQLSWKQVSPERNGNPNWNNHWPLYSPGSLNSASLLTQTPVGKPLSQFSPNPSEDSYYLGASKTDQDQAEKLYRELDTSPKLKFSNLQGILYPDNSLSQEELVNFNKLASPYLSTIANPHYIDDTSAERIHKKQINQQIEALTRVLSKLPKDINVIVLSGSADSETNSLQMGFMYGPAIEPGFLYSASVRHQALAQTSDLNATLLNLLPIGDKPGFETSGVPLQIAVAGSHQTDWPSRLHTLLDTEKRASVANSMKTDFYSVNAVLILIVCLLALFVLSFPIWRSLSCKAGKLLPGRLAFWLSCLRGLFLFLIALPAGAIFTSALTSWWQDPINPVSYFLKLTICFTLLLVVLVEFGFGFFSAKAAPIMLCATNLILALADILCGSRILLDSPISYHSLAGGRYYGMGNETYAIAATDLLIVIALLGTPWLRRCTTKYQSFLFNTLLLLLGIGFIIIDGASFLGADFGGPVSFLPAFITLVLLMNRLQIKLKRVALIAAITVLISSFLAWLDYIRPANKRSHLGRFVQSAIDGKLFNILNKKIANNLNTLVTSTHRVEFIFLLILLTVVIWQLANKPHWAPIRRAQIDTAAPTTRRLASNWLVNHYSWLRLHPFEQTIWHTYPGLKEGTIAVGIGLTLGYALNDSGIDIPGLGLQQLIPTLMILTLAQLQKRYSL